MHLKAATFITKFDLHTGKFDTAKIHAQFYKYITRKYARVTDFKYDDDELIRYDESDRKYIYLNGALDFFKVIDWSQNTLTLYGLPDNVDIFEALDSADAQIKDVLPLMCQGGTIFKYLSQSNQYNYIEKLVILNSSIDSIHFVKAMTALTTLQINFFDPNSLPINLASKNECIGLRFFKKWLFEHSRN
jgi:hypothetical protein